MTKRDNTARSYDSKLAELSEHEEKYWRYNEHLQNMRGRHLIDEDYQMPKSTKPKTWWLWIDVAFVAVPFIALLYLFLFLLLG